MGRCLCVSLVSKVHCYSGCVIQWFIEIFDNGVKSKESKDALRKISLVLIVNKRR